MKHLYLILFAFVTFQAAAFEGLDAAGDTATTSEDSPVTIDVLANDSFGTNGAAIANSVLIQSQPANGTVVINGDNSITYTPAANYFGIDTFSYTITDALGETATAVVSVVVAEIDNGSEMPTAVSDNSTTGTNTPVTIGVLNNDTFGGFGPALTDFITIASNPTNGAVVLNADGTITYTPNTAFNGTDSFTYAIHDAVGQTATGTVTVTVAANAAIKLVLTGYLNTAGNKIIYNYTATNSGQVVLQNLTLNDPLTGTAAMVLYGTFGPGQSASTTKEYTVTQANIAAGFVLSQASVIAETAAGVTVTDISNNTANDPDGNNPTIIALKFGALYDDVVSVNSGQSVTINFLANDLFNGNPIDSILFNGNSNGTLTLNDNGTPSHSDDTLTFTAIANASGPTSTDYFVVSNGVTLTAHLYINIIVSGTTTPVITAVEDYVSAPLGNYININVLQNDSFGPAGMGLYPIEIVTQPQFGYAYIQDYYNTPNNPFDDYIGYNSYFNYNGINYDQFTYKIKDALGNEAIGTVNIYLYDPSYASSDNVVTNHDVPVVIYPLNNDYAFNYSYGSFQVVTQPSNGTIQNNDADPYNPALTYTPNPGFIGYDQFNYSWISSYGTTLYATVYITVLGPGYIKAAAFLDSNANGFKDTNEPIYHNGKLTYQINNGASIDMQTSADYFYIAEVQVGNFCNLAFSPQSNSYTANPATIANFYVTQGENLKWFSVTANPFKDGAVILYAQDPPRPGFTHTVVVKYMNYGNQTIPSGNITVIKPSDFTIQSVSQSGISTTSTGFSYSFTDLLPFETRTITITYLVPTIPAVNLGQLVTTSVFMTDVNDDLYASNNSRSESLTIVGAYDPNDITESHGGEILTTAFASSDYLYYTIRFENTGSAAAENVSVSQTLDPKLDPSTLVMVSSSNDYTMTREGMAANWKFTGINLPPAVENTSIGKGYIQYAIKPLPGYQTGDVIGASASIVFDFNPAIATENFNTTFVSALGVHDVTYTKVSFSPNPVQDILNISATSELQSVAVFSTTGQVLLQQKLSGTQAQVNLHALPSGSYLVQVNGQAQKIIKK